MSTDEELNLDTTDVDESVSDADTAQSPEQDGEPTTPAPEYASKEVVDKLSGQLEQFTGQFKQVYDALFSAPTGEPSEPSPPPAPTPTPGEVDFSTMTPAQFAEHMRDQGRRDIEAAVNQYRGELGQVEARQQWEQTVANAAAEVRKDNPELFDHLHNTRLIQLSLAHLEKTEPGFAQLETRNPVEAMKRAYTHASDGYVDTVKKLVTFINKKRNAEAQATSERPTTAGPRTAPPRDFKTTREATEAAFSEYEADLDAALKSEEDLGF